MEIPEKLLEVMKLDGVVAIATQGPDGPHMVNTWNAYLRIADDGRLIVPAGYFHTTQANIERDPRVLVTLGSSKVQGFNAPGTGFLIRGEAKLLFDGPEFETTKARFSWARAAMAITMASVTQTL